FRVLPFVNRLDALGGRVVEHFFQKREARGALAFEHAAFGPPKNLVVALVSFAVPDVSARDRAVPKTENHFLGGQLPPAIRDFALVFHLVIDDGLAIRVAIQIRAAVEDPGRADLYRDAYHKPSAHDELKYEGDLDDRGGEL